MFLENKEDGESVHALPGGVSDRRRITMPIVVPERCKSQRTPVKWRKEMIDQLLVTCSTCT